MSGSTFIDNSADGTSHSHGDGGAIDNGDLGGHGVMAVSASTFAANSASARGKQSSPWLAANGGAIDNGDHGGNGELTVASSTFDGNSTDAHRGGNSNGGAIDNADDGGNGTLVVSDSTFVTNVAQNGAYGAHGGAIDNADDRSTGTLTVTASTFDINTVYGHDSDDGPLIENHDFGGTGTVYAAADIFNGSCGQGTGHGKWADGGYNIGADGTCGAGASHDRDYGDSLSGLHGPLAANGGPTPTISLLPAGSQLELAIIPRTSSDARRRLRSGFRTPAPGSPRAR